MRYLFVAAAGALAALARYRATVAVGVRAFPYATLGVNVTGAFLFGVVITLTAAGRIPSDIGTAVTVGFLGAYTTFATFAWEVFVLVHTHRALTAAAYVGLSAVLGLAAAGGGYFLARTVTR